MTPRCWNHNDSIVAHASCRAPLDGAELPLCMEVGITQTAYIPECGGKYLDDASCGTFLEIHKPGDPTILSDVRLRGQYASGYRMAVISTTYMRNLSRIICEGDHEVWWVHRTRWAWVVERRIPFNIKSPRCDWNPAYNKYEVFATLGPSMVPLLDDSLFQEDLLLFTQPRKEGVPGYPGKGMGGTLILRNSSTYYPGATFKFGNDYTYLYAPQPPLLDVSDGELYPTHRDYWERYGIYPRRQLSSSGSSDVKHGSHGPGAVQPVFNVRGLLVRVARLSTTHPAQAAREAVYAMDKLQRAFGSYAAALAAVQEELRATGLPAQLAALFERSSEAVDLRTGQTSSRRPAQPVAP